VSDDRFDGPAGPNLEGSRESGIDIGLGDECSRVAFARARETFSTREGALGAPCLRQEGAFANVMDYGSLRLAVCSDGIGTKIELAERTGHYRTLGRDLVAMVVDDLAALGAEPVNMTNVLDVDHLDPEVVGVLMEGLAEAAVEAGVAVVGGEIAELGSRVGGYGAGMHFNWSATAIGVLPPGREPIDGAQIRPGDLVVALASDGFRSNGFSLIRKILEERIGPRWHEHPVDPESAPDRSWGRALLTPSRIYSPLIQRLLADEIPLHGIAHITGGGISGNLARVLRLSGCGAELPDLHPPHAIMRRMITLGRIPLSTAYELWNMGNGMLLVVPSGAEEGLLARARELGYGARVAGRITERPGIRIPALEGGGPCWAEGAGDRAGADI
jgi:phosphoribosylformylglycinamidine cyclo-ligase